MGLVARLVDVLEGTKCVAEQDVKHVCSLEIRDHTVWQLVCVIAAAQTEMWFLWIFCFCGCFLG